MTTRYGGFTQEGVIMKFQSLVSRKPVLTIDELHELLNQSHSKNKRSRETLLSYHLRKGNLVKIRRGLYAVVPLGSTPDSFSVDPYLVASKSADDAVLAYHTALEVHGKAHSIFERMFFQSNTSLRPYSYRNIWFQCVLFPKSLREKEQQFFATKVVERAGLDVRVATLERTLVDVLDRPELGGGWEETWRSLESIEYFDLDLIVEYVKLLNSRTTAAKVGYYLHRHAKELMVDDRHIEPLRRMRPAQPHYLERGKSGKLISDWNLIIPSSLEKEGWEEVQ